MKYGFCTGFATNPLFKTDSSLEAAVCAWGYDFIEYPLMSAAALNEEEFEALVLRAEAYGLSCDCAANLFPGSVSVIGEGADSVRIRAYLDTAFARAERLGVKKIIFGSAGARRLGSFDRRTADAQFMQCLGILDEYCGRYGMAVLVEAIRHGEADYINTLQEAAEYAKRAQGGGLKNILLMADLFHMMSNGEDLSALRDNIGIIRHIHVCELNRALPDGRFSGYILAALGVLKEAGYSGTISYESVRPPDVRSGKEALKLLKNNI